MPTLDARPGAVDILTYPGNATTYEFVWPAALTGRTFTADADGTSLSVSVVGDTVTVVFSAAVTAALEGRPTWKLTETTAGTQVRIKGRVLVTSSPTGGPQTETVTVYEDTNEVTVNVLGEPGPAGSGSTTEDIQDVVGAMFSGNTETGIAATYDDPGGKINLVAEVTQAELDAAVAGLQPLDSDLTAIAALTTTAYGRSVLEAANAAALRTLAGVDLAGLQSLLNGTYVGDDSPDGDGAIEDAIALDLVRNDTIISTESRFTAYGDIFSPCPAAICGYWDDSDSDDLTIAALHRDRMVPWGFATVSDWIGDAGKLAWADVASIRDMGMEIVAHSVTHTDPTDATGYGSPWEKFVYETETCLAAIQAQNLHCDSWKEPGSYTGAWTVNGASDLDTRMMRQYRALFAMMSGYYNPDTSSYTRPKETVRRYGGGAALTIETSTLATMQSALDNCIKYGGLLVLAGHTRNLDEAGNLTTADWTTFLDYVNTKRKAGLVDCLTPTAAYHARPGPRRNLLKDPLFDESATGAFLSPWQVTGSPTVVDTPNGLKAAFISSGNELQQFVRSDNLRTVLFQGYAQSSSGSTTCEARLTNAHIVSGTTYASRTLTASIDATTWTLVEGLITVDPRANYLRLWLKYPGSGSGTKWRDLRLVKV